LVNFFLERSIKNHKKPVKITEEAMNTLCAYPWPGNVRELENTIERIVLMGNEEGISQSDMLLLLPAFHESNIHNIPTTSQSNSSKKTLDELEKEAVIESLKRFNGNQSQAAKELGITLRQIGYKIKKYEL
jgi:Nif-specific regulatory protein